MRKALLVSAAVVILLASILLPIYPVTRSPVMQRVDHPNCAGLGVIVEGFYLCHDDLTYRTEKFDI